MMRWDGLSGGIVRGWGLWRVVADGVVRTRPVDGCGSPVHQEGHTDGLGSLLSGSPGADSGPRVGGDATVAPFDHRDGERDQLLGARVERAVVEGGALQLTEALVDLRHGP